MLLRGFVSARKQDYQLATLLGVVHPVSWPNIDFQFRNTVGEIAMLPGVSVYESVDAHLNPSAGHLILESIDPVSIDLGHLYTHAHSVSYGLHLSRWIGDSGAIQHPSPEFRLTGVNSTDGCRPIVLKNSLHSFVV